MSGHRLISGIICMLLLLPALFIPSLKGVELPPGRTLILLSSDPVRGKNQKSLMNELSVYFKKQLDDAGLNLEIGLVSEKNELPAHLLNELRQGSYDIVLSLCTEGADALLRNRAQIPYRTKIVLCDIQNPDLYRILPNATGIAAWDKIQANLIFGKNLFPEASEAVIVSTAFAKDSFEPDQLYRRKPSMQSVKLTFYGGGDIASPKFMNKLTALNPETSYLVLSDLSGNSASQREELAQLLKRIRTVYDGPVLSPYDLGENCTGGARERTQFYGRQLARLLERLNAGEAASSIPFALPDHSKIVSRAAMAKFHLVKERMPVGTIVQAETNPAWEHYRITLFLLLAALVLLFLTLLGALVYYLTYRNMRRKNRKYRILALRKDEQFRRVLDAVDSAVIVCNAKGTIEFFNKSAEIMTGYSAMEMVGHNADEKMEIVRYSDSVYASSLLDRVKHSGKMEEESEDVFLAAKNGDRYPVLEKAFPVYLASGRLAWLVLVLRENTELHIQRTRNMEQARREKLLNETTLFAMEKNDLRAVADHLADKLATLFAPDRIFFFQNAEELPIGNRIYERCLNDVQTVLDQVQNTSEAALEIWLDAVSKEGFLQIKLAHPPEWMGLETFQFFNRQGVQSVVSVAIYKSGKLWGIGGMDFAGEECTLSSSELSLLKHLFSVLPFCRGTLNPTPGA